MPQRKIPQEELVNFIVKVRYFSSQTTDHRRWLGQIKNLANHMYRSYIGYTARGEYRIKAKGEHVFAEDVARSGEAEIPRAVTVENDHLQALADEMERIQAERAEYERRKREVDLRAKEAADAAHAEKVRRDMDFDAFDEAKDLRPEEGEDEAPPSSGDDEAGDLGMKDGDGD